MEILVEATATNPSLLRLLFTLSPIFLAGISLVYITILYKEFKAVNKFVRIGLLISILNSLFIFSLEVIMEINYEIMDGIIAATLATSSLSNICFSIGILLIYRNQQNKDINKLGG